jgi:hypothetical protein
MDNSDPEQNVVWNQGLRGEKFMSHMSREIADGNDNQYRGEK